VDEATRNQAEKQRTLDWINQKWVGDKQCPICRAQSWAVEGVVELRPYHGGALVMGGSGTYPLAQVICANCGYTHFFNAVLSGVVVASDYEGGNELG
jgi:predicted nucleic-acid-binding Zn-ribbon protein